jgi:hypothetical protein
MDGRRVGQILMVREWDRYGWSESGANKYEWSESRADMDVL